MAGSIDVLVGGVNHQNRIDILKTKLYVSLCKQIFYDVMSGVDMKNE